MTFTNGQRIPGLMWSHYVITDRVDSSVGSPLYRAQKILFNHRYDEQEFYETDPSEWLPVWIRTTAPNRSTDPQEMESRVKLLRYEMDSVLTPGSSWTAEPLDWMTSAQGEKTESTEEPFPAGVLVFSALQGITLAQAHQDWPTDSILRVRFLTEWLNFLEQMHSRSQCAAGFSPEEIFVDSSGLFQVVATDRILPVGNTQQLRWYFSPERFPVGYAAPETQTADSGYNSSSDIYNWGALALLLLANIDPDEREGREELSDLELEQLETSLESHFEKHPEAMKVIAYERFADSATHLIETWKTAIQTSLYAAPEGRPATATDLRNIRPSSEPLSGFSGKIKSWFRPVEAP